MMASWTSNNYWEIGMQTLELTYVYSNSEEKQLESLLVNLETEIGGSRKPFSTRAGAIDIVSFLELVVAFIAGAAAQPLLEKYFDGLFNADRLKKLGEHHRKEITEWLLKLENDFSRLLDALHSNLQLLHASFTFDGKEEAIVLEIPTYSGTLYVILNHKEMSPRLISSLPKGILSSLRFLCEEGFSERVVAFQLYYDRQSEQWVYLLAPTVEGFGNYIDRYVDLRDGEIRYIDSQADFIRKFCPVPDDTYKFLVSPFRDN
jgi:hypothetical protein